jgi:hypothetical protein
MNLDSIVAYAAAQLLLNGLPCKVWQEKVELRAIREHLLLGELD